jgi:hypothetical protein
LQGRRRGRNVVYVSFAHVRPELPSLLRHLARVLRSYTTESLSASQARFANGLNDDQFYADGKVLESYEW